MTLPSFQGKNSRYLTALVVGSALLIGTVFTANEAVVRRIRNDTLELTAMNLKSQVTVLASEVDRSLKLLDLSLSSLSDHIAQLGVNDSAALQKTMGSEAFYRLLQGKKNVLAQVDAITLISDEGKLINFSRYWPIPTVNVADRDYFIALKNDATLESFFSAPVQNRGNGKWTVYLARRLNTPNGDFMGLLLGAIALDTYESYFKTVALQDGNALTLLREDGLLLARYPHSALTGKSMPSELAINSPSVYTTRNSSPIDGEMQIIAGTRLASYPVSLVASQTESGALQNWRSFTILSYSLATASSLLVCFLLLLLIWWSRRRDLLSQQLAAQNEWFDVALSNMSCGLSMFDADGKLVTWNDRYIELYRMPPELIRSGVSIAEIAEYHSRAGNLGFDADVYVAGLRQALIDHGIDSSISTLGDGRRVSVTNTATKDGGWVGIHEDVTERIQREQEVFDQAVELARTNMRFDAALSNMTQGISLFDNERRLVVWNARYAEIYRLPDRLLKVGTHLHDVMGYLVAQGILRGGTEQAAVDAKLATMEELSANMSRVEEFADETLILVSRQPTADGGWVSTHEDITERRRAEAEVARLARHDVLTGLANRAEFNAKLEEAGKRLKRYGGAVTVMMLDLDKFKAVNDTLGHPAGDKLLIEVARRLKSSLRETDVLARLGGDEFAIIQDGGDNQHEGAIALALRIVNSITQPFDLDGHQANVGTSIGIAMAPEHGVEPEEMLKRADLALYAVKSSGRNDFRIFQPEMLEAAHSKQTAESELREAIEREEFELHYQLVVDANTMQPCGAEALVRWRHPSKGLVGPDQFIPLAESSGLIAPLGDWVLQRACADAASWPAHIKLAVNVSAVQFKKGNLFDVLICTLVETGLAPNRLELEITETVLLENQESHLASIRQLRNLGISIALDDFGTGYSSMKYLTVFPFDKIKIDKSFTQEAFSRRDCKAVIESTLALARGLGTVTTAEGVETQEQLEYMRDAGVNFVQGYLLGRPVPASQLNLHKSSPVEEMVA